MNIAHLHLILNHLPVIGLLFALALLGWGLARRNQTLMKASLVCLVAVALFTIPAFLTGEPAEKIAKPLPGTSNIHLEQHEDAAKAALVVTLVAGGTALLSLLLFRTKAIAAWCGASVLLLTLVAAGLMAWTANLGGKVRHPEIRDSTMGAEKHHERH